MLTLVLMALAIAAVVIAVITAGVMLRVAFRSEKELAADTLLAWRPAFIQGEALRNWAAYRAEELTRTELAVHRDRDAAVRVVTALDTAADHAMLPLARPAELERVIACPAHGQGQIGVNAPEAITIAARLRREKSKRELQRIHALATENALLLAMREAGGEDEPPLRCPLQGAGQVCCVYGARPLHCRPLHAESIADEMGPRSVRFAASAGETEARDSHEQTVVEGIEIGFTRALRSAGLDATVYELNSALAKALEVPDAAERWARGESIFAGCAPVRG